MPRHSPWLVAVADGTNFVVCIVVSDLTRNSIARSKLRDSDIEPQLYHRIDLVAPVAEQLCGVVCLPVDLPGVVAQRVF